MLPGIQTQGFSCYFIKHKDLLILIVSQRLINSLHQTQVFINSLHQTQGFINYIHQTCKNLLSPFKNHRDLLVPFIKIANKYSHFT